MTPGQSVRVVIATKPVDFKKLDVQTIVKPDGSGMYKVNLKSPEFVPLTISSVAMTGKAQSALNLTGEGHRSPYAAVTIVDDEARRLANIPPDAEFFCFASPLIGVAEADNRKGIDLTSPAVSFACLGGFFYFDSQFVLIGVNALFQGNGLYFEGPLPFERPSVREMHAHGPW